LLSSIVMTINKPKKVNANNGVIVITDIDKHIRVNNHVIVSSIVSKYFIMYPLLKVVFMSCLIIYRNIVPLVKY